MIRLFFTLLLFLCALPQYARAADFDYSAFAQIPVLHEGRIKPLDSFARLHLKRFSGQSHVRDLSPSAWLAQTLFDPARATETKLFFVQNKDLKMQLGLPLDQKLFSVIELQGALAPTLSQIPALLAKEDGALTPAQNEVLQLHDDVLQYLSLMRSFSMILPLNIDLPEKYSDSAPNYLALYPVQDDILRDVKRIIKVKGDNIERYSKDEQKLAALSYQLTILQNAAQNNQSLAIFPQGGPGGWRAPWQVFAHEDLTLWQNLAAAYRSNNAQHWRDISAQITQHAQDNTSATTPQKLKLEILYNRLKPYHVAMALYALSMLLIFAPARFIWAQASFSLAALAHSAAITARMMILERPPVGTLYESLLFVGLITALIALFIALKQQSRAALFAGGMATLLLLSIAPYLLQDGDSLEMLVAVLNTNFWLTIHVLCITAGYALCILSACLAHVALFLRLRGGAKDLLRKLQQNIYPISMFALLFTAVGTILGGIWADQSWGRFWGWDPKENGALLIVLWLIWLQHGRISGHMKPLHFLIGNAYLNVIVALAWFGVNLLGVGLHSYGFINGIAWSLGLFVAGETLLLSGLWIMIRIREKKPHEA